MSDQHNQNTWDQDEVKIEDLGTPDRGIGRYLFSLGEKWQTAGPLRAKLFTLLIALCLLLAVLQSGASGVHTQTSGAPHTAPGNSSPSTIYLIDCGTTINVNDLPGQTYVWEQVVSTPPAQECDFLSHPGNTCLTPQQLMSTPSINKPVEWSCSEGRPSPGAAGKNGKNR